MAQQSRKLRELARKGLVDLHDFWRAFWNGAFEKRGRTKLKISRHAFDRPHWATRDEVRMMNAFGAAEILSPNGASLEEEYELLAEVSYFDVHPTFRHDFERMEIPFAEIEKWLEGPDGPTGERIKRVLREAARVSKSEPSLSINQIASRLTKKTHRFADYGPDSIRKILGGRYPAQKRLGIPGLRSWHQAR